MPSFEVFYNFGLEIHVDWVAMVKRFQRIEEPFDAIAWIVGVYIHHFQAVKDDEELTTKVVKSCLPEIE